MSGRHGSGSGGEYAVRPAPLWDRGDIFDEVLQSLIAEHTVPIVVGDRWLPRHVVLGIVGTTDFMRVFDSATGGVRTITRQEFTGGQLPFRPLASLLGDDCPQVSVCREAASAESFRRARRTPASPPRR